MTPRGDDASAPTPAGRLLVADSFRARVAPDVSGSVEVRGWALHRERFAAAVHAQAPELDTATFLDEAEARIAESGAGFPRLELWETRRGETTGGAALRLVPRPLPPLTESIELRTAGYVADRQNAEIKGPNVARHAALNEQLGAEALLLDRSGAALEGATTSLLWWEGERLMSTRRGGRVASVTERLVRDLAAAMHVRTAHTDRTPEQLQGHELWAVNALHGLRPVRSLDGIALRDPDHERLTRFRTGLDRCWESVSGR